jgi:hypothetical protein
MSDFPQLFIQSLYILLISLLVCIPLWSIVWAARDAEARGRPGWLVALFVILLVWPLGLILWLMVRPATQSKDPMKT